MVVFEVRRRDAIILRIELSSILTSPSFAVGMIANGEGVVTVDAETDFVLIEFASAAAAVASDDGAGDFAIDFENASTSFLTMRPAGPDPVSVLMSMLRSAAIFRARGEILIRAPLAGADAGILADLAAGIAGADVSEIAALFGIPVVYIIENNGYSMGTSQERSSAYNGCLAQRAEAYAIEWDVIDGSDLYEVRAKTQIAMERARKEHKPTVLEIDTYRYYGHSVADSRAKKYRTPEEIEDYKLNHDPITVFERRLIAEGVLTEELSKSIHQDAKNEAAASAKFADESPAPTVADISTDIYWESDHNTPASQIGHHFFND